MLLQKMPKTFERKEQGAHDRNRRSNPIVQHIGWYLLLLTLLVVRVDKPLASGYYVRSIVSCCTLFLLFHRFWKPQLG